MSAFLPETVKRPLIEISLAPVSIVGKAEVMCSGCSRRVVGDKVVLREAVGNEEDRVRTLEELDRSRQTDATCADDCSDTHRSAIRWRDGRPSLDSPTM